MVGSHVVPHRSAGPPRIYVFSSVVNCEVLFQDVQVRALSLEIETQILGVPMVESALASRRTSIPWIVEPSGIEIL